MAKFLTEDEVRDADKLILGFNEQEKGIKQGTGQMTKFNTLGFEGVLSAPDGWYIPDNKNQVAIILEAKKSDTDLGTKKCIDEIKKNCNVLLDAGYKNVVGLLHNGYKTLGFLNSQPIDVPNELHHKSFYINMINEKSLPTQKIYEITKSINNNLRDTFGVKNIYHRMIFTACALVAERYGARLEGLKGREFSMLHNAILSTLNKSLEDDKKQNNKLHILEDIYAKVEMNFIENQKAIDTLIQDICTISDCINSNEWNGEDITSIFFSEFHRYKKKADAGQVFTPEHIAQFMYRLINITPSDYVGDFTCGSGTFLVKSMSNMIYEAGGYDTNKAKDICKNHLFGIELDKEMYALACANMLIHKDGKTNLDLNDTTSQAACDWIKSKNITKVLMNPPYENKFGCMTIVENVLDSVKVGTECAFILPDKKLEKASNTQMKRILSNHKITKIVKLPEDLFFGVGITTSIFVFIAGKPQEDSEIFGCYIEDDGFETVKNEGRHDTKHKWKAIEDYWIDSISKHQDTKYNTAQWIKPSEHLSYQMPEKPFEISEEDFRKTAIDYLCFKHGITTKEFKEKIINSVLYKSKVSNLKSGVSIKIHK